MRVGHQGTEIGRSGRDGQREDRQQDRRLDQRGDGDLAAGAHPAERGAGVDPGQGQRDGAQEQQTRRRRTDRRPDPAVTRWPRAARSRRSAGSCRPAIAGAAANTTVVPCGVICCLPSCLRRSRQGCRTPPPARPSNAARTCRIRPITSGAPATTSAELRGARDVGHQRSPGHHQHDQHAERAVGEVEVHAAGVGAPHQPGRRGHRRAAPAR